DIIGILLVNFANLMIELTKIKTVEDIKSISQPVAEVFSTIDEAIKNGSLTLPYMVKTNGISSSFSDIKNLSNSISNILTKAQIQKNNYRGIMPLIYHSMSESSIFFLFQIESFGIWTRTSK
ncbi:hypothetical protein PSI15_15875, partial [Xenorhabdus sp. PR6a]|uniref:hypothetical protein n=1 Tax=Xenorhabdus sp. PR6a TaxID=3025877 RepID=UPI00235A0200